MAVNLTQIRKGMVVKLEGQNYQVVDLEHRTPGNLRAFVQLKLKNMSSGSQFVKRFSADEQLETVFLEKRSAQYLYPEGKTFVFMDNETYEQIHVPSASLGEAVKYLKEGDSAILPTYKAEIVGVDLPAAVELTVTETEPGVQGDRVSGARKPATLETGLVVQVPLFVEVGERIKVDTRTGEYLTRA